MGARWSCGGGGDGRTSESRDRGQERDGGEASALPLWAQGRISPLPLTSDVSLFFALDNEVQEELTCVTAGQRLLEPCGAPLPRSSLPF